MKHKAVLLKLADILWDIEPERYNTSDPAMDALHYASKIPEIKKAFKKFTMTDAEAFFGIDDLESQHLFGTLERDEFGKLGISPFGGTAQRGRLSPSTVATKNQGTMTFEFPGEPPAFVANRIRAFVYNYEAIQAEKKKAA